MSKVLLLGSTGLLGQALIKEAKNRDIEIIGVARTNADINLDITDDEALSNLIKEINPDIVINTCAIVNHKLCDDDTELAYDVNARPSAVLANLADELDFYYIYISTDGYYNGDGDSKHATNDGICLLNEYARTKYAGECLTLTNKNSLVVRTNIVGFRGKENQPTFVEWAIEALKNEEEMTLFDDYFTSSITVTQFSKALFDLLQKKPSDIINLASSEVSSKEKFIKELALALNLSLKNTKKGSIKNLTSSKRADSLGLDVSKTEELLGYKLPDLKAVIKQIKDEYNELG